MRRLLLAENDDPVNQHNVQWGVLILAVCTDKFFTKVRTIGADVCDGQIVGGVVGAAGGHDVRPVLEETVGLVVTRQLQVVPLLGVVAFQRLHAVVAGVRHAALLAAGARVLTMRRRHNEHQSVVGARHVDDVIQARV